MSRHQVADMLKAALPKAEVLPYTKQPDNITRKPLVMVTLERLEPHGDYRHALAHTLSVYCLVAPGQGDSTESTAEELLKDVLTAIEESYAREEMCMWTGATRITYGAFEREDGQTFSGYPGYLVSVETYSPNKFKKDQ